MRKKTIELLIWSHDFSLFFSHVYKCHSFQNRIGPGGRTVKTENRDENRFFKPKEPDFLLIPWTAKTEIGPHEPVRTVRSNPLAIFFFLQFYST